MKKAHPRHNDQHTAGDVDGDQVVGELTLEYKLNLQAAVFSWKYIIFIYLYHVLALPCLMDICWMFCSNWFQCTVFTYCLQLVWLEFSFRRRGGVALPERKFIQLLSNSKSNYACSASHLWILEMEHSILKEHYYQSQFSFNTQRRLSALSITIHQSLLSPFTSHSKKKRWNLISHQC